MNTDDDCFSYLCGDGPPVRRAADFLSAESAGEVGEEDIAFRPARIGSLVRMCIHVIGYED